MAVHVGDHDLQSEIGDLETLVVEEIFAAALQHQAAVLEHIGAVGGAQHMMHVLLDDQHGQAVGCADCRSGRTAA